MHYFHSHINFLGAPTYISIMFCLIVFTSPARWNSPATSLLFSKCDCFFLKPKLIFEAIYYLFAYPFCLLGELIRLRWKFGHPLFHNKLTSWGSFWKYTHPTLCHVKNCNCELFDTLFVILGPFLCFFGHILRCIYVADPTILLTSPKESSYSL